MLGIPRPSFKAKPRMRGDGLNRSFAVVRGRRTTESHVDTVVDRCAVCRPLDVHSVLGCCCRHIVG